MSGIVDGNGTLAAKQRSPEHAAQAHERGWASGLAVELQHLQGSQADAGKVMLRANALDSSTACATLLMLSINCRRGMSSLWVLSHARPSKKKSR
ncbi:hypothetical protein [Variovorax sp. PAMC26660]|uniref:hypothetical protein n=1 Tax=Variovorax sp. PAMC26660 TaxID=2762322 RepID=UPI00164DC268|nr:hypothetical protein [Variovorax sp. PAMC26660]QNK69470.1 hypothetical protein H7F35_07180 [Variovorax sp. PAMC26660]